MKLKIGKINFLNLYPIFYTLEKARDPAIFEFIEGTPAELNLLIRDNKIDISPSSSIEYLRRPERYTIIDGHSISSVGPVQSILLFSKYPIEELNGKTIWSSEQSETSTALLKIILKKFYGLKTEIAASGLSLDKGLESVPAYMLIGDNALKAAHSPLITDSPSLINIYDLGKIWHENTGLPFVYALWIGRKECCNHETFIEFIGLLDRAKEFALQNFRGIAGNIPDKTIMDHDDLISYWKYISYDLDDEHKKGLELFRKYLEEEDMI